MNFNCQEFKTLSWFLSEYSDEQERYWAISDYLNDESPRLSSSHRLELLNSMCDYTSKRCGIDPRENYSLGTYSNSK